MHHASFAKATFKAISFLVQDGTFLLTVEDETCLVRFRSRGYEPSGQGDSDLNQVHWGRDADAVHVYAVPDYPLTGHSE